MKAELERKGMETNIVYGALPPEARRAQADQFNLGRSVLIATDAVGLGLNLNIRRVIFTTARKFDGDSERLLTPSEVKQISGRAGRGHEKGLVTAMKEEDLIYIKLRKENKGIFCVQCSI